MSPAQIALYSLSFALAPLLLASLAKLIAAARGCELNAAKVDPCIVAGVDISNALYTMFLGHFLAMLTFPLGMIGLLISLYKALTN